MLNECSGPLNEWTKNTLHHVCCKCLEGFCQPVTRLFLCLELFVKLLPITAFLYDLRFTANSGMSVWDGLGVAFRKEKKPWDCNPAQINTWNKQKCCISITFSTWFSSWDGWTLSHVSFCTFPGNLVQIFTTFGLNLVPFMHNWHLKNNHKANISAIYFLFFGWSSQIDEMHVHIRTCHLHAIEKCKYKRMNKSSLHSQKKHKILYSVFSVGWSRAGMHAAWKGRRTKARTTVHE